jgi:lipoprotein-anchoring transpeptidase ErfK/SrfK
MNKRLILAVSIILSVLSIIIIVKVGTGIRRPKEQPATQAKIEESAPPALEKSLLAVAESAEKNGDLLKAREAYKKFMERFPASDKSPKAQEALENLNMKILTSSIAPPDSLIYEVKKGDNLVKIAKKFNTTVDLITKANKLKDSSIRISQKLKISGSKFSIVVDKSQNILTLKSGQDVLKTYRVSTGKNSSTPVGTYNINSKIIDPPWYPPTGGMIPSGDPKNVLGSRWLGLTKPSYGIHGTTQPESIGQSVTEGCIRMKNSDVEELYTIVPVGTEVVIVD